MFNVFILASATLLNPVPVQPKSNPASWFSERDLPKINKNSAVTSFELTVNDSGVPSNCRIVVASGSDGLDTAVCNTLMKKARFKPAKDIDGEAIASGYRDRVVWWPNAMGDNRWFAEADVVVSTKTLTKPTKSFAEVLVMTAPADTTPTCVISRSIGSTDLDRAACAAAINPQVSPPIIVDGTPVKAVRMLRVGFTPASDNSVIIR